jgi:nickel-dependent lactate racemase
MKIINLPYGSNNISVLLSSEVNTKLLLPKQIETNLSESVIVKSAIQSPVNGIDPFQGLQPGSRVVITVNDKTRPVPNSILLPPLLSELEQRGIRKANIIIIIASGTHAPMEPEEFHLVLDQETISNYQVLAHDCDDMSNLVQLGVTEAGTTISINRVFNSADLRIVVGDIELHHFAGYSGGVKSAAIGLGGRETINKNHSLLIEPLSSVGNYENNPLRQDIESIGKKIKVDLSLNAILDEQKKIIAAFFGRPVDVMREGIRVVQENCQIPINEKFDLVIASAGGYPKDINLYQSQKAMTHASLFCKKGGSILLVAECREGVGSSGYLNFMQGVTNIQQVFRNFRSQGFSVGPHKAFQIARLLDNHRIFLHSSLPDDLVTSLLLEPVHVNHLDILKIIPEIPLNPKIAILPFATACIPKIEMEE